MAGQGMQRMDPTAFDRRILFEDNHLLAINKPAGLLSQGDVTGDANVVDLAKDYRIRHENKAGEAYVGLVHRLDRPVSGVIVLAKTSKAASRLNRDWGTPAVEKLYRAVVSVSKSEAGQGGANLAGLDTGDWSLWTDLLVKDSATNTVRVVQPGSRIAESAQAATLEIRLIRKDRDLAELEIRLGTGRGHQIRVQLASRGLPVVGDSKYGSKRVYPDETGFPRLALHAWRLTVPHPTLKRGLQFTATLPPAWPGSSDERITSGFAWQDEPEDNPESA
jgi:23S rRNA pseudouridine1911/1915/1917 synthase